jgi:hypothetical protein
VFQREREKEKEREKKKKRFWYRVQGEGAPLECHLFQIVW